MSAHKPPADASQLASFASLPYELRARIIEESYLYNRKKHDHMSNLLMVSRDVYALVAPDWYRAVRITRPSTLASFLQAVMTKPALGHLATSLWLGPKDLVPQDWWPMGPLHGPDEEFVVRSIATSLADERRLPQGCHPHHRWPLSDLGNVGLSPIDKAVLEAISVAQNFLDVDLKRPRYAASGSKIGSMLWLIGVVEVQAVLDLYLLEIRRLEDEARESKLVVQDGEDEEAVKYPSLELTTAMPVANDVSEGRGRRFTLHRTRLLQYLAQQGGPADYFDHPIIFARSGIKLIAFTGEGRGSLSRSLWQQARAIYTDGGNAFVNLALPSLGAATPLSPDLANPLDPANLTTASVGGNLHLARQLLSLTPNVETLFLSGFLQRILCGKGASLPPPTLRTLCLGPLFPLADESLSPSYEGGRLADLRELRIRGDLLDAHKRACITALPNLERIDWDLAHSGEDPKTLIKAFKPLVNEARAATAMGGRQKKRSRAAFEGSESSAESTSSESNAQPPELAGADADCLSPIFYIGVAEDCEDELPNHFDSDAVEGWNWDASFYERPWRVRIWYTSRHGEYEDCEEHERPDLADRRVIRAYDDVRTYWSLVGHFKRRTRRGQAGWE